jgi:hypothetical protein
MGRKNEQKKMLDLSTVPFFGDIAGKIIKERRGFLNRKRFYTLWEAVKNLRSQDQPVAEVGVFRGGSAKFILKSLEFFKKKNRFYIFDTFSGHIEVNKEFDGEHRVGKNFCNTTKEEVSEYLSGFAVSIFKGDFKKTSIEIDHLWNFGLVHLDVDVYPTTVFALDFFYKHTVVGSMIVVDDYGNVQCGGVRKAVDEFANNNMGEFIMFYIQTGQALLIRIN